MQVGQQDGEEKDVSNVGLLSETKVELAECQNRSLRP